jgi:hypothetical protein
MSTATVTELKPATLPPLPEIFTETVYSPWVSFEVQVLLLAKAQVLSLALIPGRSLELIV